VPQDPCIHFDGVQPRAHRRLGRGVESQYNDEKWGFTAPAERPVDGREHHDPAWFIKAFTKSDRLRVWCISSITLDLFIAYCHRWKEYPGVGVFRYVRDGRSMLGSERLAKRVLELMGRLTDADYGVRIPYSARCQRVFLDGFQEWRMRRSRRRGGWSAGEILDLILLEGGASNAMGQDAGDIAIAWRSAAHYNACQPAGYAGRASHKMPARLCLHCGLFLRSLDISPHSV